MSGKYYDDLEVGQVIKHRNGRTVTEMDNVLFSALTMNTQPLHLNEDFASRTEFGQRIVNGLFTLSLATGLTVAELTEGTFHGDTLYVETEVLDTRDSRSRPDAGIVRFRHVGRNQHGTVVIEFERTALMLRRPQ
jgi:acyl dehydratase